MVSITVYLIHLCKTLASGLVIRTSVWIMSSGAKILQVACIKPVWASLSYQRFAERFWTKTKFIQFLLLLTSQRQTPDLTVNTNKINIYFGHTRRLWAEDTEYNLLLGMTQKHCGGKISTQSHLIKSKESSLPNISLPLEGNNNPKAWCHHNSPKQ